MNTMTATIEQVYPTVYEAKITHPDGSGSHYLTPLGQEAAQKWLDKMIPKFEAEQVTVIRK